MKSFVCLALLVLFASAKAASTVVGSSSSSSSVSSDTKQDVETDLKPSLTSQLNPDYTRFRKSAGYGGSGGSYGGGAASIPAPPCPKNYLFSCQPNLAPVPCAAPAAGGYAGAYSAPVPTYASPLGNNYGLPQGYGGFVPQNFNHFYHQY